MPTKASFLFSANVAGYEYGWSENYWSDGTPIQTQANALELAKKLINVHSSIVELTHVRMTPTDITKPTILYEFAPALRFSKAGKVRTIDQVRTAMLISLENDDGGYRNRQWVRGISDQAVDSGAIARGDDVGIDLDAFLTAIKDQKFGLYPSIPGVHKPILGIVTATGVFNVDAHGFVTGDRVKVGACKGISHVNGTYTVTSFTLNGFRVKEWNPDVHSGVYIAGSGTVQKPTREFKSIDRARYLRISSHQTGRPFALLSGHHKKVRAVPGM